MRQNPQTCSHYTTLPQKVKFHHKTTHSTIGCPAHKALLLSYEETCLDWVRYYILYHKKQHPAKKPSTSSPNSTALTNEWQNSYMVSVLACWNGDV